MKMITMMNCLHPKLMNERENGRVAVDPSVHPFKFMFVDWISFKIHCIIREQPLRLANEIDYDFEVCYPIA